MNTTTLVETLNSLVVPWKNTTVSTLGGKDRASVFLKVSLDSRETWVNGIYENSRYAIFCVSVNTGKVEMISGHNVGKFRKCSVKNENHCLEKIRAWLS